MSACVAVISNKNSPLFFKTPYQDDLLSFQFRVYAALDVVEEKVGKVPAKSAYSNKDSVHKYLGLLYSIDDYSIYGYITNTNVKFILVQEYQVTATDLPRPSQAAVDEQAKQTFELLYSAYIDLISSPFYVPNTPIDPSTSNAALKFESVVDRILKRPTTVSKL